MTTLQERRWATFEEHIRGEVHGADLDAAIAAFGGGAATYDVVPLEFASEVLPPHSEFWLDHFDRAFVTRGLTPAAPAVTSNSAACLVRRSVAAGDIVPIDVADIDVAIDVSVTVRARAVPGATVGAVIEAVRAACATG